MKTLYRLSIVLIAVSSFIQHPLSYAQDRTASGTSGVWEMPGQANITATGETLDRPGVRFPKLTPGSSPIRKPSSPGITITVTTTDDTGFGSLRHAIDSANTLPGTDIIKFSFTGSIHPLSPLPAINDAVIIDGSGGGGQPQIELNGSTAGTSAGLALNAGGCTIRGLIINQFSSSGIVVAQGSPGGNVIRGCYIGTDASGYAAAGNGGNGILINAPDDTIGGLGTGDGNVISGNVLPGIFISPNGNRTIIRGNAIGTDLTGTLDLGNLQNGIEIYGASDNIIGDTTVAGRNLISGNDFPAIYINGNGTAAANIIIGNYIGTDMSGYDSLGDGNGIVIDGSPGNIIGGIATGARNIISGLPFPGIFIKNPGATGNSIINNFIGTTADGRFPLGNTVGIVIDNVPGNRIGGTSTEEGNLISGNSLYGISVRNPGATGNTILGNFIGTDLDGTSPVGNGSHGVLIISSQDSVRFNTIEFNGGAGVYDSAGGQNLIQGNTIAQNTGLDIDLAPPGITKNDSLDADTGPNDHQNFPLLDSASVDSDGATVHGHLQSSPNSVYQLEFYANSGYNPSHFGGGERYVGALQLTTDAAGNAAFTALLPIIIGGDQYITATATDASGNTSEFSQALCLVDSDGDGLPDSWETEGWGIDVNSDGLVDLDLNARGAHPDHKDIFVEIDAMTGMEPQSGTLDPVVEGFKTFPGALIPNPDGTTGVDLHCLPVDETDISLNPWPVRWWEQFDSLRNARFGTLAERTDTNARFILEAKRLAYRYCIFAYTHDTATASGRAKNPNGLGGNRFMVTLGKGFKVPGGTEDDKAGTFMHELGHTLGLMHGGGDNILYKPNYISVMNYTWQFKYRWGANFWSLNYSPEPLPALNESNLNEVIGLNPKVGTVLPQIAVPFSGKNGRWRIARLATDTVDWNDNGVIDSLNTVPGDLNVFDPAVPFSPGQALSSQSDWDKLVYNFRNSPSFKTSSASRLAKESAADEEPDLTGRIYQHLDSIPLPKPAGKFVMDGQPDTSASHILSGGGLDLYARVNGNQLYLAAASTPGQDLYIFVTDKQNPLRQAPQGKGGKVAAWSAYLHRRAADNSTGWFNQNDSTLENIAVDTTGTVVEGVIDLGYLFGKIPTTIYVACGRYDTSAGGSLTGQIPSGNSDANIDVWEYYRLGSSVALDPDAPYIQQGPKLVGNDAFYTNTGVEIGDGVSLSGDGNTALVGGSADGAYKGAAWIFNRHGNVWTQPQQKLVGTGKSGNSRQGYGVALSEDGSTAAVGGFSDSNDVGAVWIYSQSGGVWQQQGPKLVATGSTGRQYQGWSVALSSDGNTLLVGANQDNNHLGAAWVFTRTGSTWSQQGTKLVGSGAASSYPWGVSQGTSVALSADGNTALVGGPNDDTTTGAVWIFKRTGSGWLQSGPKLIPRNPDNSVFRQGGMGMSVSISADGHTAIFGTIDADSSRGCAWVFSDSADIWRQDAKLVGTGATDLPYPYGSNQGYSVALSRDGNTAVIGGMSDSSNYGAIWTFYRKNGTWLQSGPKLVGSGAIPFNGYLLQGYSVSVSSDGTTILSGGPNDNQSRGAAWVFAKPGFASYNLIGFTATPGGPNQVRINWTTGGEVNDSGFVIQRKLISESVYQDLPGSFTPGHGTTFDQNSYVYLDSVVPAGKWDYRLKQISRTGALDYSSPVTADILTGVKDQSQLPREFALYQSYPNPFNPSATIRFDVPHAVRVSIRIYNVLGQMVADVDEQYREAGRYAVVFNAPGTLASGVYFYRIEAGTFVQTKKFMLLK